MLLARTGLAHGRLWDSSGNELTSWPDGAGAMNLGSWSLDHTGLNGNTTLYDGEWSGLLADGRYLPTGTDAEEDAYTEDAVSDDDGEVRDRSGAVTQGEPGRYFGRGALRVNLLLGRAQYGDAGVWTQEEQGSAVWLDTGNLGSWLDDLTTATPEVDGEGNVWWAFRKYLRYTLHWAIYTVPVSPTWTGWAQDRTANSAAFTAEEGIPAYGPFGFLSSVADSAYAAQNYTRLWEPSEGIRFLTRGQVALGFDSADYHLIESDPDMAHELDADEGPADFYTSMPSGRSDRTGRTFKLSFSNRQPLRLRDDELVLWHIQTAPARIAFTVDSMGFPQENITLGAPTGTRYGTGPYLTLHDWRVNASRPRRRR